MRKVFAFVWTILAAQALTAGPVSPGRALDIGRSILDGPPTRGLASEVDILWNGEFADSPKVLEPAFYVVGREEGGFVIISADDNAHPVLALSETNRFSAEKMPDNVRWWMERMKAYVRAQDVQSDAVRTEWANLAPTRSGVITGTVTDRVEHLTPEWNQAGNFNNRLVYNKFCPLLYYQGNYVWTYSGCVPTALAEILTVMSGLYPSSMPSRGTGQVGGYAAVAGGTAPSAYTLSTAYDWPGLRTLVNEDAIRSAALSGRNDLLDNLGHLMADCGAITHASYEYQGTGVYVDELLCRRMAEHLYMSKSAHVAEFDDYTPSRWIKMLKDEIAARPILYSGVSPTYSGHAFVFDGYGKYNGADVFHVNFGWGGTDNGYYFLDNLDTDLGNFSFQGVVAILDFYPDAQQQTTVPTLIKYITFTPPGGATCNGITALSPVVPGQYLSVRIGGVKNVGNYSYTKELQFYHEDKGGNRLGYSLLSLDASSRPIEPGHLTLIDRASIYIYRAEFGDRIVGYFVNGEGNEEEIMVEGDGSIHADIPLVPAAFIRTETSYSVGDRFRFRLKNYDKLYAGTTWTITAPNGQVSTLPQSEEGITLSQAGEYRIKASIAPSVGAATEENVVTYITVR